MAIDKKFPKAPSDVICVALYLLRKRSVSLKEKDQEYIHQVGESITGWLKDFRPSNTLLSDVSEL